MSEHSITPLSAADIWVHCDGYASLAPFYAGADTNDSREGTAAHALAAGKLTGSEVKGEPEMEEAVEMYYSEVNALRVQYPAFAKDFHIEERVAAPSISPFFFGTCDCWLYHGGLNTLWVWDFKYGHGLVDAVNNWQLTAYTACILEYLGINGAMDQKLKVAAKIVQPRAYHEDGPIREWRFTACDIRGAINRLKAASERILSGSQVCTTGSHCKYCPARFACKACNAAAMSLYEASGIGTVDMTIEQMALQYTLLRRVSEASDLLKESYKTQLETRAKKGERIPGYALQPGRGKLVWKQTDAETLVLGQMLGVDLSAGKVKTPTQVKGLIAPEVLEMYTEQTAGALRLVPEDNLLSKARRIFDKNNYTPA